MYINTLTLIALPALLPAVNALPSSVCDRCAEPKVEWSIWDRVICFTACHGVEPAPNPPVPTSTPKGTVTIHTTITTDRKQARAQPTPTLLTLTPRGAWERSITTVTVTPDWCMNTPVPTSPVESTWTTETPSSASTTSVFTIWPSVSEMTPPPETSSAYWSQETSTGAPPPEPTSTGQTEIPNKSAPSTGWETAVNTVTDSACNSCSPSVWTTTESVPTTYETTPSTPVTPSTWSTSTSHSTTTFTTRAASSTVKSTGYGMSSTESGWPAIPKATGPIQSNASTKASAVNFVALVSLIMATTFIHAL